MAVPGLAWSGTLGVPAHRQVVQLLKRRIVVDGMVKAD